MYLIYYSEQDKGRSIMPHSKDKPSEKVKVNFYSGYKDEETPRSVIINKKEYIIEKVISRERIFEAKTGKTLEAFTCKTEGRTIKLRRAESDNWTASFSEKT